MAAAIEKLPINGCKKQMAILGDMGELGDVTAEEHQDLALAAGITKCVACGDEFGKPKLHSKI